MKRIFIFSKRCFKETLRDPLSLVFLFAVPVTMLILFYFAFHKLTPQFEIGNISPAMCGFAVSFLGLFTGLIIAEDRTSTFLTRLYTTPVKSYEFIFGYLFSMLPFSVIQSVILLGVACLLDVSFFSAGIFLAVIFNVIISVLFISFGILLGSLCSNKSVGGASSIIIMGQSMLSGMWFPLNDMSKTFVNFLNVLPFKNCSDIMIKICANDFSVLRELLIIMGYTLVVLVIAVIAYRTKMKKS